VSDFKLPSEPVTTPGGQPHRKRTWREFFRGKDEEAISKSGYTIRSGGFNLMFSDEDMEEDSLSVNSRGKRVRREREVVYETATEAFEALRQSLTDVEVEDIKARVARAVSRANEAKRIGQVGLSQDLLEHAAGWVLEQQVAALGCDKWVEEELVRKVVRETARDNHLSICNLREFPRVIPTDVQAKIAQLQDLFTTFVIVFTNPEGHKVKDRDPILFGVIRAFSNRLYYVTDWVDEYCDLTMEKFVEIAEGELHDRWQVNDVMEEPSDADLQELLAHVRGERRIARYEPPSRWQRFLNWLRRT